MSQVSGFLRSEVTKYKDIDHILNKLEDDGEVQNVFEVFRNIFDHEFQFTLQELLKIQEAKKEPLNLKKQCENNLSLFKNNLVLIVQMIIDKALKTTLTENKAKYGEGLEATAITEETAEPVSFHQPISPIPKKREDDQEARQPRNRAPRVTTKDSGLNLSMDSKNTPIYINEKKSNLSHLSTAKLDSPLSQILPGVSTPVRNQNNTSRSKDRSFNGSPNVAPMSAKSTHSSLFQPGDSLNNSRSFVQSEFNHVRGNVKFSKSPKGRYEDNYNPGPGTYQAEPSSLKQSPSPKLGKAAKICWFDAHARNDSPGPAQHYPSKHFLSTK